MKKILAFMMAAMMLIGLCGCGRSRYDYDSGGSSSGSSFTNDYGTSSTRCAVSGCNNTIARSGDTNCCTKHSNRCLECNCYIDGDAMYCMDCLEDALGGNDYDYDYDYDYDDYDYDDYDYDYDYDMPKEGESFSDYVQRVDPDLYSDMEDILNSLE